MNFPVCVERSYLYKHVVTLSETDQFRHLSYANYLKLVYVVTDLFFLPMMDPAFLAKVRFKVINSRMEFRRQTEAGSHILIQMNALNLQDSGFDLVYQFMIEETRKELALAQQRYALINPENQQPVLIPESVKKLLGAIAVDQGQIHFNNRKVREWI